MSTQAPPQPAAPAPEPAPVPDLAAADDAASSAVATPPAESGGPPPIGEVVTICSAAFLAAAGAGWMAAGVFEGVAPRLVAVAAALLGAGIVALSYRVRRPALLQYFTLPVAIVAGALLVIPDAQGGSANLPSLIADALLGGGIAEPPVAFDPGWRFVLATTMVLLSASAASLALGFNRPNLAVFLPVPVLFSAALVQPPQAEILSTVVGFVLLIAALAVAYGVELSRSGVRSGRFELRRLGRGVAVLAVLAVGLVVLANVATFLLPEPRSADAIPPQRPQPAPPMEDRELFTVGVERVLPWRLGVLDVYEENAWKLPPYDVQRFLRQEGPGDLPDAPATGRDAVTAAFTISDLPGRALPTLAGAAQLEVEATAAIDYDPRTQTLRMPRLIPPGFEYTVTAPPPPTTDELTAAPEPPEDLAEFLEIPEPPAEVAALLAEAPSETAYATLQFVRRALYTEVVAAGAGQPEDVPPARVVEMLDGGEATPFEITAAEALLARWAGVPSRLGYGYYGGTRSDADEPLSIHPEQGSTWLEVYFEGHGWVPLIGKPAQARSSLSDAEKREDPSVRPTDELALITYVPVRLQTITLLFELVRHYLIQALPILLALVVAVVYYPALLRLVRRGRRRRWAQRHGVAGRVATSYAELRDVAWDLNIGHPSQTPLEFGAELAPDAEHTELAWLVSRVLWGDLARDPRPADADAAAMMAASVTARLRGAQPLASRLLAAASRASLRAPYSTELPNFWLNWSLRAALRRALLRAGRWLRRLFARVQWSRLIPARSTAMYLLVVAALLLPGCVEPLDLDTSSATSRLPDPAVPARIDDLGFKREPSAEKAYRHAGPDALIGRGRVWSVNRDDVVEGSLQIAEFKPSLFDRQDEVRDEITQSLGGGRFEPVRVGDDRAAVLEAPEQRIYLWFSPDGTYYELFVARRAFEEADDVFGALLAFQRGEAITSLDEQGKVGRADPRRGIPQ